MAALRLVGIGCGARTRGYLRTSARWPDRYQVVAGADPVPARVAEVASLATGPFQGFDSAAKLLAAGRIGDVAVVGTQDADHLDPALGALELGYDLLLEKPIATNIADIVTLERRARELGRRVVVCHILRYSALYETIHRIVARGDLGEVTTLDAREGLGAFHYAHSYVRGHWARAGTGTPMIVAKCCHDTDLISWMVGDSPRSVASFGSLSHFRAEHRPAAAPPRCTDGCTVACRYDARRYLDEESGWLDLVMDGSQDATPAQRLDWIASSPWGRCVYQCDNDVVDHQVLAVEFAGGATATLTMTGLDDDGRSMVINGTQATLHAGDRHKKLTGAWITVTDRSGTSVDYGTGDGDEFAGHAGGDLGIIDALDRELALPPEQMRSGLAASLDSHLIAFAAEESRLTGRVVDVAAFAAGAGAGAAP